MKNKDMAKKFAELRSRHPFLPKRCVRYNISNKEKEVELVYVEIHLIHIHAYNIYIYILFRSVVHFGRIVREFELNVIIIYCMCMCVRAKCM